MKAMRILVIAVLVSAVASVGTAAATPRQFGDLPADVGSLLGGSAAGATTASAPADAQDTCDGAFPPTAKPAGAVVVSAQFKAPGAAAFADIPADVRVCNYFRAEGGLTGINHVTVSLQHAPSPTEPMLQNISAWVPNESVLKIVFDIPASEGVPSQFIGALDDPSVTFAGQRVTVQGTMSTVRWPQQGTDCATAEPRGVSMFDIVTGSSNPLLATVFSAFAGAFVGTNAHTFNPPQPATGGLTFAITGCGDGDPATPDGFAKGFVPLDALELMGLPTDDFASAPAAAIDGFLAMTNNGAAAPGATFTRATVNGRRGIAFTYSTSFSPHTIAIKPDVGNLRVLKACSGKQLKSKRVAKGKAKGKTTLSCKR